MKVKTIGPVQHDGKEIELGTVLNLSNKAARQLVDVGAAEELDKPAEQPADDNGGAGQ